MINDISAMNPKGHVKLELYNDEGTFYTKEKRNLVVQSANKIVAEMMSDPAKVIRVAQNDKGDTALSANSDGLYPFDLTVQHEEKVVFQNNWGETNVETQFTVEELKGLTSLDEVKVGANTLSIDVDIFVKDSEQGVIEFATAPVENVTITFHKLKNPYMNIIQGTEKVVVDGVDFHKSESPNVAAQQYAINYKTGEILFDIATTNIEVSYDYHMNYSLGFMSLGGKPNASHPNYQPVEFGQSNKLDIDMKNEYPDARMPVQYPSEVSYGATEFEPAIPTQPVRTVLKTKDDLTIIDIGDGSTKELSYTLPNLHDSGSGNVGRLLHEIVSVTNTTKSTNIDVSNVTIKTNTSNKVEITFADGDVEIADVIKIDYRLKLDNLHLIYELGQSPVVEIVSVKHTRASDGEVRAYNIVDSGLRTNQGDVWISNSNTGHIMFSSNPTGGPQVETPGQLTVEYKVNSGTTVKFVADFPKGVPSPTIEEDTKSTVIANGQTSILLDYAIAKEGGSFIEPTIEVTSSGSSEILAPGQYEISSDGRTIMLNSVIANDLVNITYSYEKATHDIYQVAMFDNKTGGKMFNISGIGPVTKDKNTGMRVSWSVTF